MAEQETNILNSLSKESQKLAIAMCHFMENGGKIEAIEATSGLDKENLAKSMNELEERGLVQRGLLEISGQTTVDELLAQYPRADVTKFKPRNLYSFREDKEGGDRYRLTADTKTKILKQIFPPDGVPKR